MVAASPQSFQEESLTADTLVRVASCLDVNRGHTAAVPVEPQHAAERLE